VVKEKKYEAFGNLVWSDNPTYEDNREFTGKEKDPTGFHYFGARYYSGDIGRFLTPDPHTVSPGNINLANPQSLNPYVYCINDPLMYFDPNGLSMAVIPLTYRNAELLSIHNSLVYSPQNMAILHAAWDLGGADAISILTNASTGAAPFINLGQTGIAFLGGISEGEAYGIVAGSMATVGNIWLAAAIAGSPETGGLSFLACLPGIFVGYGGAVLFAKMAKDEYGTAYGEELNKYGWTEEEVKNAGGTITGVYNSSGQNAAGITVNDPNIWRGKGYKVLYEGDGEWSVHKPE